MLRLKLNHVSKRGYSSLQIIWFNQRMPDFQMSCRDLTTWQGIWIIEQEIVAGRHKLPVVMLYQYSYRVDYIFSKFKINWKPRLQIGTFRNYVMQPFAQRKTFSLKKKVFSGPMLTFRKTDLMSFSANIHLL